MINPGRLDAEGFRENYKSVHGGRPRLAKREWSYLTVRQMDMLAVVYVFEQGQGEPPRQIEVAKLVGLSRQNVYHKVSALVRKGLVRRVRGGKVACTAEGRRVAQTATDKPERKQQS